ncbi:hypothetical protein ACMX2H_11485 [Arthrobacter sulfonylureivorans]|uniref:hypothetical protein n=1 Tax=Arthrobacter sulfonylureivorans TaxID=2486855 RepID=UPI0039E65CB7
MTKNPAAGRSRVSAGLTEGGQFAVEAKSEATGVSLDAPCREIDKAAIEYLGRRARSKAAYDLGDYQRKVDRGRGWHGLEERMARLEDMKAKADNFENLGTAEQQEALSSLQLGRLTHLLQPGQTLGNSRVAVADDLDANPEDLALALEAQKQILDERIPGDITLTKVESGKATFVVKDGSVTSEIEAFDGYVTYSAVSEQACGEHADWLYKANRSNHRVGVRAEDYNEHHEYAVMMDAVADSPIKFDPMIVSFDRKERSIELGADGSFYTYKVSGHIPELRTESGTKLHTSMLHGFMNYVAVSTGTENSGGFTEALQEVFRETERRLVR